MHLKTLFALAALAAAMGLAGAQDAKAALSLDEAIAKAVSNQPLILQAEAGVAAAKRQGAFNLGYDLELSWKSPRSTESPFLFIAVMMMRLQGKGESERGPDAEFIRAIQNSPRYGIGLRERGKELKRAFFGGKDRGSTERWDPFSRLSR